MTFWILLALFITIGLVKKAKNRSEYLFANRKTGLLSLTATLVMTELNPATLIAFSGLGYLAGPRALLLPLVFLIGLFFYSITVAKKYSEHDPNIFEKRFSKRFARFANTSLIIAMFGFTATYVKSLSLLFDYPLLVIIATLIMTLRGGLGSIIRTDIASFFLTLIILPLIFFYSPGPIKEAAPALLPSKFIISLIILTMFTYILAPWYSQKIYSAKSPKVAVAATALSSVIVFALYSCAILATSSLHIEIAPEKALPYIISTLPPVLKGASLLLLFLAGSTTLAGVWNAIASMLPTKPMPTTLLSALISYLLGIFLVDNVLDKMILANIPVAALSFALLSAFYWKGANTIGAYISCIVGLCWGCGSYLLAGDGYTWIWAIYGIPLIFVSGYLGSISTSKQQRAASLSSH